ncbi:hypothetical protein JWG39_06245 [Desulforhopalus vacuolatus]|uniref:glycine zipper domain-containing protein n=1 Tax=Desulforhopalus vacuolatus TaxID=40414 RepID=UPI00196441C1|nr:glycine zipper domain-containing protein [Desulforhopalus vacuolatus]MBM9519420.1 hypothetical protein [Desulforhopalus vacuolatus]
MKKICCILLSSTLLLSSCAGMNDSDTTRAQGAGVGAAGGAAAGVLLGQIIGKDSSATLLGAAIGAAMGAGAGYLYGNHVANQKEKFASQEDWLNACIASATRTNQEARAYNNKLAAEITSLQARSRALKRSYKKKIATRGDMLAQKQKVENTLKTAQKNLAKVKYELKEQQTVVQQIKPGESLQQSRILDSRIADLKKAVNNLEKKTATLASLSATMSV